MSSRRIENKIGKAKYGPSMNEVLIGAALSLILGAVVAAASLMATPVKIVRSVPQVPEEKAVYYAEGTKEAERGKQWLRKKQLFLEGSTVSLNEDELNAWISAEIGTSSAPVQPVGERKTAQAAQAPAAPLIQVGTPNFRVRQGVMQVGCRATLNLDWFALSVPLIAQASGRFERRDGQFVLVADQCYVGSFPVHKVPGLDQLTIDFLMSRVPISEDVRTAWKKLNNVAVEGNLLRLSMP
jgi:hypothetical protein